MTNVRGQSFDASGDDGKAVEIGGVTIARDDLRRNRLRHEPQRPEGAGFDGR
jgi:hypothetical protein